jgi:hypothetical protein
MKRFSEQFHTKSKSVSMTQAEKQELRERLVSYMEYHPLPAELKSVKKSSAAAKTPVLNEAFKTVSLPFSLIFKSSAVAAALVMVVVPFMAEQSVPGDTLYAVKVQFNEEVRGTLTFDSYQKVEWETQRVNRRIAEARLLESEGRLTDEVEAEVAQAVRTHTQNAQREIENLREFDAEEATIASIEFDSNLEAQAASLKEDDDEQIDETAVAMRSVRGGVKTESLIAAAVDESRALNEQPTASTTPSFAKLSARVEQNTTRMYELSDKLESLNPKTKTDVARRIEDIERSVEEAIVESTNDEQVAREILVDVLKRTQKLIVFMTDLEVSDTVDIEELVPVVLTDSEEVEMTASYKAELETQQEAILKALETIDMEEESDIIEKIESGLSTIATRREQMEGALSFKEVKLYAKEAIELADDLLLLLEQTTVPEVILPEPEEGEEVQASSTVEATSSIPVQSSETEVDESTASSSAVSTSSTTTVDAE